jgi:hypothetical protein
LKSFVTGVSISDTLSSDFKIYIFDTTVDSVNELCAPITVSFTRIVTSVIFSPEEGIYKKQSVIDPGFESSLLIFNIGCTDSVTYEASVWDCQNPMADALPAAYANETRFPIDYGYVNETTRNGTLKVGSADPANIRIFLDPHTSITSGGLVAASLPVGSNEASRLGVLGILSIQACIQVRFTMQTQSIPLIKNIPIQIDLYENCPVGYYSPTGTSEKSTCIPCPARGTLCS